MNTLRYADLFCGLGAFHTAFDAVHPGRFTCVLACDIDPDIRRIYSLNYGLEPLGDIRQINWTRVPDFDILCAGFPCQPFSIAGNGRGFEDTEKGNLFLDLCKAIDAKHPSLCILENVKNLQTHDEGRTYTRICSELEKRGYTVTSQVLNAAQHGSPQARERIFLIATRGGSAFPPFPDPLATTAPVSSILDHSVQSNTLDASKYILIEKKPKREKSLYQPIILYDVVSKATKKGGRQGERVYSVDHVGITVCASSGGPGAKTGLYKVGSCIRRLTVDECLSMFGFPLTYRFPADLSHEKQLFFLGNSIVVTVLKRLIPQVEQWFGQRERGSTS